MSPENKVRGSMTDPNPSTFLEDPLSTISRAEHRNLLISCVVALLVSFAGLVPSKVSALGIELTAPEQRAFIITLAGIILYFSIAFLAYGLTDFFIWRQKYQNYLSSASSYMESWTEEDQHHYEMSNLPRIAWLYRWAPRIAVLRIFFEYGLPLIIGTLSIAFLVRKVLYP